MSLAKITPSTKASDRSRWHMLHQVGVIMPDTAIQGLWEKVTDLGHDHKVTKSEQTPATSESLLIHGCTGPMEQDVNTILFQAFT